jgi:xylulokinase
VTEPLFAGVDLGTARAKIGVFDRHGVQLALQIVPHSAMLGARSAVTQDAEHWWRSVCQGLRAAAEVVDASHIVAIAVCGQGPTLVTTDARLHPRGPALTWMDQRAVAEAAELTARLGRPVDAGRLTAKALRLARLDPDPERRWYFQAWDYIAARLCATPMTSSAWAEDEIAAAGLPRDHFPRYVPPGMPIGDLTSEAARVTGLRPGIPVVAGTNDSIASCIGSGIVEKGRSVILGGTSGGFVLCWDPVPGAWAPPPDTYPEPPGLRYLGATIASSGLVVDWLASLCGLREYDGWLEQAAAVPTGAEGLVLLPYISGVYLPYTADERAPLDDPEARGVLFGIGLQHSITHLIRAALEGIAFATRQLYEVTVAQGGFTTEVVTVGGQAHSAVWNQIKADVLGLPVMVPSVVEAGALGAACFAATGSGAAGDLWAVAARMVHMAHRLEPNLPAHRSYSAIYASLYIALYPRLSDLFSRRPLSTLEERADQVQSDQGDEYGKRHKE